MVGRYLRIIWGEIMSLTKIIHNAETNEIVEVELTATELAEIDSAEQAKLEFIAEQEAKATEKAALLAKLGITEAEAKLLLS